MNDKQLLKRVTVLAKAECCNMHGKDCIWDECRCHLINPRYATIEEGAIDCDWFMQAVLPQDKELERQIWQNLTGEDGPSRSRFRLCERCRNSFLPLSNRQKFCAVCSEAEKKRRSREKQHRYDEKKRTAKRA